MLARVLPDTTRAARQGPTVLVDPKGTDYARYRHAHILTPNETELVDTTPGVRATGDDDMASRVRRLHVVTRCRAVLVTRGARGMDLFEFGRGDARRLHIDAAQTHEVYEVTGAGDTVTAVMALAAAQGFTLGDAARFANAAAAVVVRHVGTAVVEPDTLEQATRLGGAAAGSKVLTPAALASRQGYGLGQAVGAEITERAPGFQTLSILAAAYEHQIPATLHVTLGADTVHMHPRHDGAALGAASLRDFHVLADIVTRLDDGGLYLNLGSAVTLPEVVLKAINIARNVTGRPHRIVTANFDMIQHYRPLENVVGRPTRPGGRGYAITGHHEILFPLLYAMVRDRLS